MPIRKDDEVQVAALSVFQVVLSHVSFCLGVGFHVQPVQKGGAKQIHVDATALLSLVEIIQVNLVIGLAYPVFLEITTVRRKTRGI